MSRVSCVAAVGMQALLFSLGSRFRAVLSHANEKETHEGTMNHPCQVSSRER